MSTERTRQNLSNHGMPEPPGDEKLREALIYVANRLVDERRGRGAVKLNKVLWWADFESYRCRGRSVTGAVYQKLPEGPAPRRLLPVRKAAEIAGDVKIERRQMGGKYTEHVIWPTREHDPTTFDADDIRYLDEALVKFHGLTASQCSEFSHERSTGWQCVDDREVIPYFTVIVDPRPLTESDRAWAREVAVATGHIPG